MQIGQTHPTIRQFLCRKTILFLLFLLIITTTTIPALPGVALWARTHLTHMCTATLLYEAAGAGTGGAMGIQVEMCDCDSIGSSGNGEEETLIRQSVRANAYRLGRD
jgi:hypothetical protein